jgi:uncharacterized membrane protein YhfC
MAGIFEETARFISFKILKKKYNGIETGLAYGIGHGGIEAIVVGGLPMVNTIVVSIMINTGAIETITGALQGAALEQTTAQLTVLLTTPSYSFLAGGIERLFAIGLHMSLSIIVFYSVYGKNKVWLYPLAILLHAVMDIPAAAMQAGVIKNVYVVELFGFISAIIFIVIARYIHKKLKHTIIKT